MTSHFRLQPMLSLRPVARIGRNQVRNALNLLRGRPVFYPPLGSVTLEKDDVRLARQWLKQRSRWDDAQEVREYEFARFNGSGCPARD